MLDRRRLTLLEAALAMRQERIDELEAIANNWKKTFSFIHFSDLKKLGLNPKTKYGTPAGVYGYIFGPEQFECLFKSEDDVYSSRDLVRACGLSEFATDRKFIHVGSLKKSARSRFNFLHFNTSKKSFSSNAVFNKCVSALADMVDYDSGLFDAIALRYLKPLKVRDRIDAILDMRDSGYTRLPGVSNAGLDYFYDAETISDVRLNNDYAMYLMTRRLSKSPLLWGAMLLEAGFAGVRDDGNGWIHKNEPRQQVIFRGDIIDQLTMVENLGKEYDRRRDLERRKTNVASAKQALGPVLKRIKEVLNPALSRKFSYAGGGSVVFHLYVNDLVMNKEMRGVLQADNLLLFDMYISKGYGNNKAEVDFGLAWGVDEYFDFFRHRIREEVELDYENDSVDVTLSKIKDLVNRAKSQVDAELSLFKPEEAIARRGLSSAAYGTDPNAIRYYSLLKEYYDRVKELKLTR